MSTPICPKCKMHASPGAKFCRNCGQALPPERGKPKTPAAAQPLPAAPPPASAVLPAAQPLPATPPPSPYISLTVEGNLSGVVIIGDTQIQLRIGNPLGAEAAALPRGTRPAPVFKGAVSIRPPAPPALLGRQAELQQIAQRLAPHQPVEVCGPDGVGKSSLLAHFAQQPPSPQYPDGIVHLTCTGWSVDDVLQRLYECFYSCGALYLATPAEAYQLLRDRQALIVLDDISLSGEQLKYLLDALPGCTFLIASPAPRLGSPGQAITLGGLPPAEALQLISHELGRPLDPAEITSAQALVKILAGHPLHLQRAIGLLRRAKITLAELVRHLQGPAVNQTLLNRLLGALSEPEYRLVSILAALSGASATTSDLAAMLGVSDIQPILDGLLNLHLVGCQANRCRLTGTLARSVQSQENLAPRRAALVSYYLAWVERNRQSPSLLAAEMEVLQQVMLWAVNARQWAAVLRLARSIQPALALGLRWSAWAEVLRHALTAARAAGDRASAAWALHELGTRSLCLGERDVARKALNSAWKQRQEANQAAAALLTRHNLDLLLQPPAQARQARPAAPRAKRNWKSILAMGTGILLLALLAVTVVVVAVNVLGGDSTPTPVPESARPTREMRPGPTRSPDEPRPGQGPPINSTTPTQPKPVLTPSETPQTNIGIPEYRLGASLWRPNPCL